MVGMDEVIFFGHTPARRRVFECVCVCGTATLDFFLVEVEYKCIDILNEYVCGCFVYECMCVCVFFCVCVYVLLRMCACVDVFVRDIWKKHSNMYPSSIEGLVRRPAINLTRTNWTKYLRARIVIRMAQGRTTKIQ